METSITIGTNLQAKQKGQGLSKEAKLPSFCDSPYQLGIRILIIATLHKFIFKYEVKHDRCNLH